MIPESSVPFACSTPGEAALDSAVEKSAFRHVGYFRQVSIIATKEFSDRFRSGWVIACVLVWLGAIGLTSFFGMLRIGQIGVQGYERTVISLLNLVQYVVPLLGLLLGYDLIVGEKEEQTLRLIVAGGVSRTRLVLGKFFGGCLTLAVPLSLGFAVAGTVIGLAARDNGFAPFLKLASKRIPNLAGIKFTHENLMDYSRCLNFEGGRYNILIGRDEILLAGLALGATGAVGSTYNYMAAFYHQVIQAFQAGDWETARRAQLQAIEVIAIMSRRGGVSAAKAMMKLVGLDCGPMRPPLQNLSPEAFESLTRELERVGFPAAVLASSHHVPAIDTEAVTQK